MFLSKLLSRFATVHVAKTKAEREAIYRFRYDVYVDELKRDLANADHERRMIIDVFDEDAKTIHIYTGDLANVTSCARLRIWAPGQVPAKDSELFSMERFANIDQLVTAEVSKVMIRPTLRGKLLFPSLLKFGFEIMGTHKADLVFVACLPGLVRHYRTLGARPYAGRLYTGGVSGVPLVIVMSDHAHFRKTGSIVAEISKKHYGPGRNRVLDLEPYSELLEGPAPVEFDPTLVWNQVEAVLVDDRPTVFDGLSQSSMKKLLTSGYMLELKAGNIITLAGRNEREIYVILEGVFEVNVQGRVVAALVAGQVFGEVAFFSSMGERTAQVRAIEASRVLVLRRKFMQELTRKDPDAGFQLMSNLARVLSDRFASMLTRV